MGWKSRVDVAQAIPVVPRKLSSFRPESVSSLRRNRCPVSPGMGVQFAPESVSSWARNTHLFPMNDDYVLKVTTGESYFFWNRNYALGSPPSDIKRISIESAENVEELIAKHGLQLITNYGTIKHYSIFRDTDFVQHIVHDGKYQITIMNESSNEVGKKIQYCIENPTEKLIDSRQRD